MSMLLTDMATEVARQGLGAHNTAGTVDLATSAIKASMRDWSAAKDWNFLLKDTVAGFRVVVTSSVGATIISAPSTGAFDGVNKNVTVTVVAGTLTLPASTTVSDYTRNTDGTIATITLSAAFTGSGTTATLAFSGDIPIIAAVSEYNLPTDFSSPYSVRLLTDKRLLEFIRFREWNKKTVDQEASTAVVVYTIYNPASPLTQNYGTYRMRVFGSPATADTARMQYFRLMVPTATTVDIPDNYIDMFIDYAIWRLVRIKNTEDSRLPHLYEVALGSLQRAMTDDEGNAEDEQIRLISQIEAWSGARMLSPLDY